MTPHPTQGPHPDAPPPSRPGGSTRRRRRVDQGDGTGPASAPGAPPRARAASPRRPPPPFSRARPAPRTRAEIAARAKERQALADLVLERCYLWDGYPAGDARRRDYPPGCEIPPAPPAPPLEPDPVARRVYEAARARPSAYLSADPARRALQLTPPAWLAKEDLDLFLSVPMHLPSFASAPVPSSPASAAPWDGPAAGWTPSTTPAQAGGPPQIAPPSAAPRGAAGASPTGEGTSVRVAVIGTDTGVGKTMVATHLVYGLRALGRRCWVHKPIACGDWDGKRADDGRTWLRVAGDCQDEATVCPFQFPEPASPHLAAAAAGAEVRFDQLVRVVWELMHGPIIPVGDPPAPRHDLVVEGAGGLLTPLCSDRRTIADLLVAVRLPVILVTRPDLGTINHTALTVAVLRGRGIPVLGMVLNHAHAVAETVATRTIAEELTACTGVEVLDTWPFQADHLERGRSLARRLVAIQGTTGPSSAAGGTGPDASAAAPAPAVAWPGVPGSGSGAR